MPLDTGFIGPVQNGIAGELTAVVAHNHPGFAVLGHDTIQLTRNTRTQELLVGNKRKVFTRAVINYCQNAKTATVRELVRDKIQ